jgi:hypothetical protein
MENKDELQLTSVWCRFDSYSHKNNKITTRVHFLYASNSRWSREFCTKSNYDFARQTNIWSWKTVFIIWPQEKRTTITIIIYWETTPKNFNIFEKVFFLVLTFRFGRCRFNSLENTLEGEMCGINTTERALEWCQTLANIVRKIPIP